ncbi:RsmE family RNA methyltransferase [Porphyromonas canoris]|nr:RsmE family RNA methyltransferase [Porphyromonas canoris]
MKKGTRATKMIFNELPSFYCPDVELSPVLSLEESAHAVKVLRLQSGARCNVLDGKGKMYACTLAEADPKAAIVSVDSVIQEIERGEISKCVVCMAPTKNRDRTEWFIEKAVELGVSDIILLHCDRSEREKVSVERLEKIMVSAMKQSRHLFLPSLSVGLSVEEVCRKWKGIEQKFIAYCAETFPKKDLASTMTAGSDSIIMIGPEGDFTDTEVQKAVDSGYIPVSLGTYRLRTETAALYALASFRCINDRKQ